MTTNRLGVSHAPVWMICPASPSMAQECAHFIQPSDATDKGLDNHHIARCILINLKNGVPDAPRNYVGMLGKHGTRITLDDALAVGLYIDDVVHHARMVDGDGPLSSLLIEHYEDLAWIYPGMVSISDAGLYDPTSKSITVWDYKNGVSDRDPAYDWQMVGNGLALANKYPEASFIDIRIVQPNCWQGEPVKEWRVEIEELKTLGLKMRTGAELTDKPDALCVPGLHCSGCAGRVGCEANRIYTERLITLANDMSSRTPKYLEPEELSRELDVLTAVKKMAKERKDALDVYAFQLADKQAVNVPGYKLAQKRSLRVIEDEQAFVSTAEQFGYSKTMLYHDPKLLSPNQLEQAGVSGDVVGMFAKAPDKGKELVPMSKKVAASPSWLIEVFSKIDRK